MKICVLFGDGFLEKISLRISLLLVVVGLAGLYVEIINAFDCGGNWTVSSRANSAKGPINVWKYKTIAFSNVKKGHYPGKVFVGQL